MNRAASLQRKEGRRNDEARPVKIPRDSIKYAEGPVLIEIGGTKVICTASGEEKVPPFLKDKGRGTLSSTDAGRSEEHTSELPSQSKLVCRLLLEKKKNITPL